MVVLTPKADKQVSDLEAHYEALNRIGAVRNLLDAVERAKARIMLAPAAGLLTPRPYPNLKRTGRLWLKEGRYWISYTATNPPAITGVFFETVDIPRHV